MEVHVRGWKCSDPQFLYVTSQNIKNTKNQSAQSKGICYIEKCMEVVGRVKN